ncbi:hypothetical protein [Brachybacterium muris]|uniref:hypothetical protein n=1 Tax=Brachybacterium muris TaxID=219301 RepID=UPI00223B6097|nr:hypothetical protein [Brachybacterium muris]MCT1655467.1 hypothetical protein [Brachybacterium muris]
MEDQPTAGPWGEQAGVLLDSLTWQWFEAVDIKGPSNRTRLVTSRGWVLCGSVTVPGGPVTTDDARFSGAVIAGCALSPAGPLTLTIADEGGSRWSELVVQAPWAAEGPRGEAVAMRSDARLGVREESGPRFATDNTLATWARSEPAPIEIDLLESAEDDWLSPGDVVSALRRVGITDDAEIRTRGIDLLARLIARGDVVAGHVGAEGFIASEDPVPAVIEHVGTVWSALGSRRPGPGQIAWFDLTESGQARLDEARRSAPHAHR